MLTNIWSLVFSCLVNLAFVADMTTCSRVETYRRLGVTCFLLLEGRSIKQVPSKGWYLSAYTSSYHGRLFFISASLEFQISRSVARILDIQLLIYYVKSIFFLGDVSLLFPTTDVIDIMHLHRALANTLR